MFKDGGHEYLMCINTFFSQNDDNNVHHITVLVANISELSVCLLQWFTNVYMLCQPPVISTVSIGTFVVALLAEADLLECGVKIVISM